MLFFRQRTGAAYWPVHHLLIWLFAVSVLGVGTLLTLRLIEEDRAQTLAAAETNLVNLGRLSQEHAERTFYSADQMLRLVRGQYLEHKSKLSFHALIDQGLIDTRIHPFVAVINARGFIVKSSLPFSGQFDSSDSDYFRHHRDASSDELLISRPLPGRLSGQWSIQLSRRITRSDGSFGGVVMAVLDPAYFTRFYSELDLGEQALGGLFGLDGAVFALQAGSKTLFSGDVSDSSGLLHLAQGGAISTLTYRSVTDGVERVHHFRKLPSYALVVAIGKASRDVFSEFEKKKKQLWWQALIAGGLLLALASGGSWYVLTRQRHSRAQAQALSHLETLTNRAPGVIFQYVQYPDGRACFPFASEGLRKIYRLDPEELKLEAAPFFALTHPDDAARIGAAIERSASELTPWVDQYRIRFADGTVRWVSGNAVPQRLADGAVRWHGFLADATEQKQAEELLITLSAAVEQSPVSIVIADLQGLICYVNPMFERITGYTRAEAMGQNPRILSSGQKSAQDYRELWARLKAGKVWEGEFHNRRKDGTLFWEHAVMTPIFDAQGVPLHYLAVKENITERKLAEAQLRIAATAFEAQEGMCITDAAGVILRVNQAFSVITGYSVEDSVGQTMRMLNSGRHDARFYAAMWQTIGQTGVWQGEIWNRRKNGDVFPEWLSITAVKDSADAVTHYVSTLTDISKRKAAEAQIQHLAFYDSLTGLPNRRLVTDRLKHLLETNVHHHRYGALLFLDLDNFKNLNDSYGHDQGDLLLQQVSGRLAPCVRKGDTVARLGGDEFVVMLQDLSDKRTEAASQTEAVGQKILATMSQPFRLGELTHYCTASLGLTLIGQSDDSVEELLKRADLALYQAKGGGRNTLRFFDPEMQAAMTLRAELESDLRQGLQVGQFLLYYQPQVDQQGHLLGVEALVRWLHPVRGMVSPAQFIPLAEERGLILPLGQWVLETACRQLSVWATQPHMAHLTLAVNVSALQFHQENFVRDVLATIELHGASASRLKLELTESLLVSNVEDIIVKMQALKAQGVGFSLDDFGTGYSSLSYLKRLPLDQLKIDQSFLYEALSNPKAAAIVRATVTLGQSLGMMVIAEGVETLAQRDFLAGEGCHNYQGYYFGRPAPADDLARFF